MNFDSGVYSNFPTKSNQGFNSNFGQNMTQGMNQNMGQNMNQNMNQNMGQNLNQNMNQNMGQNMNQNMNQNMGQNINQNVNPNTSQGMNSSGFQNQNSVYNYNQNYSQNYNQGFPQNFNQNAYTNFASGLDYSSQSHGTGNNVNNGNNQSGGSSPFLQFYNNAQDNESIYSGRDQSNGGPYLSSYLQKVSNRNPSSLLTNQLGPQSQSPSSIVLNQSSSQQGTYSQFGKPQGQSHHQLSSQATPFISSQQLNQNHAPTPKQSIWKVSSGSQYNGDSSLHTVERPKRATFGTGSGTSGSQGHYRSLSAGHLSVGTSRPSIQNIRAHYSSNVPSLSSTIQTAPIPTSMSTSSLPLGGFNSNSRVQSHGSLDQMVSFYNNSATTSGSPSYSHSSCSTDDDTADERIDALSIGDHASFHAYSTSPHSSSNSVHSSLSFGTSHSSVGSTSSIFSQRGLGFNDFSDTNSLMKIPEGPSTSPSAYNPHVMGLETPPTHGSNILFGGYMDGRSTTSSYGQFSGSSGYSQFGNGPWSSRGLGLGSFFDTNPPTSSQPQAIGANLQLVYQPSSPQLHHSNISNGEHTSRGSYSHFNVFEEDEAKYSSHVAPRYSTTPSSPATSRPRQRSHSTPSSPSGTPNVSPPKGYGRKPRSLGPSPQKPRPGNSRQYPGWASGIPGNGSSRVTPPKSRQKTRVRSKEETQATKQKYKDLSKQLKECSSFSEAKALASTSINEMPVDMRWKICMDLADMAKRENHLDEARHWFMQVNILQPQAAQGWLEYAKLEEECGNVKQCHDLLMKGLQHCQQNESLLIKAVKFFENINRIDCAREILARLQFMSIEKNWKIFLEGALLESRDGNSKMAREIFKLLMHKVKRHGPIFYEAYKLEERCEEYSRALRIVEKGLEENPRYGPLWFAYLHLLEREATHKAITNNTAVDLTSVREAVTKAVKTISSELVWKVYFEAAHIEERANETKRARNMYARSVVNCLKNLRWKVWLAGARTELNAEKHHVARELLNRALKEVPNKTRAQVLIECSRLEEYYGNIDRAREFLSRAKQEAKHEWKVFLESILLEMRSNNIRQAIQEAMEALTIHRGTGRLWAVLIQLKMVDGPHEQIKIFQKAIKQVPKSGEVWCEGARIRLNPLSPKFNLEKARSYLNFAIKFTPQYGDSFIEYLRLELLSKGPRLEEQEKLYLEQLCVNADPNYGPLWFFCKLCPTDPTRSVLRRAKTLLRQELLKYQIPYQKAILRYACKSTNVPIDTSSSYSLEDFAMSLQSLTCADDNESRKKRIFGSEQLSA